MTWTAVSLFAGHLKRQWSAVFSLNVRPGPLSVLQPQLAGVPLQGLNLLPQDTSMNQDDDYSIWFAVPKRKHTRSRKRMKTTVQKRIPLKKNIVFDTRTGEVTLQHKLPFNWKDYLPKVPE